MDGRIAVKAFALTFSTTSFSAAVLALMGGSRTSKSLASPAFSCASLLAADEEEEDAFADAALLFSIASKTVSPWMLIVLPFLRL